MANELLKIVFKVAPFVAFFATFFFLLLSPHDLGGSWSGGASKFLLYYLTVCLVLFWLLKRYFFNYRNLILLFFSVIFLFFIAGVIQILAAIYFTLSCICLGLLIARGLSFDHGKLQFLASGVIGAAVYALIFNALLSVPVHYQFVYFVVFALPIIAVLLSGYFTSLLLPAFQGCIQWFKVEVGCTGSKSFFIFIITFTYVAAYILFPNINPDENAVHLAVWTQFKFKAFFTIDPSVQIWSAAPNTLAVIHGVLSVLSNGDAKGALNFSLLVFLLGGLFKLFKLLDLQSSEALALSTLFLTTPLVIFSLTGLQTDLFLALLMCVASVMLIDLQQDYRLTTAIALIFLGSLALSAKLPAVTLAGFVLLAVVYLSIRKKVHRDWGVGDYLRLFCCLITAAALAFWPYWRSYVVTGNPVFPLYNAIFQSEFFDYVNFKDMRWYTGPSLMSYYGLFFESKSHLEAMNNFVGGFQYFLLAPLAVIVMFLLRIKSFGVILLLALCYFFPLFFSLQYLRYFFAAMPLLSVLIGVLYLLGRKGGSYRKWLTASIYATAFLNVIFMPGVYYLFLISPFVFFSKQQQAQVISNSMPEYQLNKEINQIKPNATVLMDLDRSYGATLTGRAIYNSFYAPEYSKAIGGWVTQEDVHSALKLWNVDFIYWDQKKDYSSSDLARNLLRNELITYGKPLVQVGKMVAFTVSNSAIQYQKVFIGKDFETLEYFNVIKGQPQIEANAIKIGAQDVLARPFELSGFTSFKYSVEFSCEKDADYFVAHIDWGNGMPFYKLLQCHPGIVSYTEVGLLPAAIREPAVVLSVRTESFIKVHKVSLEVN